MFVKKGDKVRVIAGKDKGVEAVVRRKRSTNPCV